MLALVGFSRTGVLCRVNILCRRRTKTRDLDYYGFITRFCEVISSGRFGIKAPRREGLEPRLVELISVSDVPSACDDSCHTIIAVGMRGNLRMSGHSQHDRIDPTFIRVTLEHYGLYATHA